METVRIRDPAVRSDRGRMPLLATRIEHRARLAITSGVNCHSLVELVIRAQIIPMCAAKASESIEHNCQSSSSSSSRKLDQVRCKSCTEVELYFKPILIEV